ncbi:unnamed protein product, partial [Scytosiphon promiscuus]
MLPEALSRERDRVECMTFMGLLPEIDHAWMTVDNVLYLWNYHTQDFTQFRDLEQASRGQIIVTVALVPPKKGVFQGAVKHLLAVATTVEVILLAITYEGGDKAAAGNPRNRRIQVRPTNFRSSTDGVSMLKIAAHPNGRIFMAGKDGNLYELTYSVAYGFWYSVFYVGNPASTRRCERLTHKSVLVDVIVDPLRNVLYTLDLAGDVDLFDLGADGNNTTQKNNVFNIGRAAYLFSKKLSSNVNEQAFKDRKSFQVVSLGVVGPTESKEIALVAVSNAGARFFMSCGFRCAASVGSRHNFRLTMVQIRFPPPEKLWQYLHQAGGGMPPPPIGAPPAAQQQQVNGHASAIFQPADGFSAKWERQTATPTVYGAYCCSGLTVVAQAVGEGDRLVVMSSDLITRAKRKREMQQEEPPSMREAVTEIGGLAAASAPPQAMGKVWAISERPVILTDSPESGRIRALLATAASTPTQSEINAALSSNGAAAANNSSSSSGGRGGGSTAVAARTGSSVGTGVLGRVGAWRKSGLQVEKILPLPELGVQPYSDRRELLCLTGAGLQVLTTLRPVDLLYELLAQNYTEGVSLFFDDFSPDQSAAMCFSIACGLPHDVGAGPGGPGAAMGSIAAVPTQTKFANSAVHNGLQLFISRLLRPLWFLPVVVAPPPPSSGSKRSADGRGKSAAGGSPPVILDLEALRAPLESLIASIRIAFPAAALEVHAAYRLVSRAAEVVRMAGVLARAGAKEWRGERALGADGQLARACAALGSLGLLEAVVDEGVYRGGGVVGAARREEARLECYRRVLSAVRDMRVSKKVDDVITRCLSYKSPVLDKMLFGALEEHDKTLLMSIRTPGVERYLEKDPELLFRHYMLSKEYPKAVYLMDREARVEAKMGGSVDVRHRVDCLLKAISACHKCDLDSAQV